MTRESHPVILEAGSTKGEVMYWHVHVEHSPYCIVWGQNKYAQRAAGEFERQGEWARVISSDYNQPDCPYRQFMETKWSTPMASPTKIALADATEIDASTATCEECNEPLSSHGCKNGSSAAVIVSRSGLGTTRKKPEEKPVCPHCGMNMHFNYGATAVNATCLTMQYAVDKGIVTDPLRQRSPVMTLEMMGEIVEWAKTLTTPPTYGQMVSAAGGAGTYAGLRPATGRKKKALPAADGEKIEDIAASVAAPAPKAASSKGRKKSGSKASSTAVPAVDTSSTSEETSAVAEAEEIVASKARKSKAAPTPAGATDTTEAAADAGETPEQRRERRAAERAQRRKALLAK